MRQQILSLISATCAILVLGMLVAPEHANANQAVCPAGEYPPDGSQELLSTTNLELYWLQGESPGAPRNQCVQRKIANNSYDALRWSTAIMRLFFVGGGTRNSNAFLSPPASGARLHFNGRFVTLYDLVSLSCVGAGTSATRVTMSSPFGRQGNGFPYEVGQVLLDDGQSCQLTARWEYNGNYAEFAGTLRRTGDFYSVDANSIMEVKGVHVTKQLSISNYSDVFDDGQTDTRANSTVVGSPKTLEYYVWPEGPFVENFVLTDDVFIDRASNVENVSIIVEEFTPFGTNELRYKVTVTYTATDPDFGFHVVLPNNYDFIDDEFRIVIGNPGDATTPTTDSDDIIDRTKRIISNFMARRAAQIVGKEPDLTKRLAGGNQSKNTGPVAVSGTGTTANYNLAFATSMRQVLGSSRVAKRKRASDTGSMMALGAGRGSGLKDEAEPGGEFANRPLTGFGFWTEGTLSKVEDGTSKSDFDMLFVGMDYRVNSHLVVGMLAQYDRTDEADATNDFSIKGKGWLAGPYVVARLSSNLVFDARAAWGKSNNQVSPYNTYTDTFDGRRLLARGRLTGDFTFGALNVAPHVGVVYYEEEQKAYVDSLGNLIGSQKVELGRLTFGPKLSTTFVRPDGATVTPHISVHGIWDFRRTDLVNIGTGIALTGTDDFRARAQAGITARRADGMAITAEGFYDGIGANGFNSYGTSLRFDVPF